MGSVVDADRNVTSITGQTIARLFKMFSKLQYDEDVYFIDPNLGDYFVKKQQCDQTLKYKYLKSGIEKITNKMKNIISNINNNKYYIEHVQNTTRAYCIYIGWYIMYRCTENDMNYCNIKTQKAQYLLKANYVLKYRISIVKLQRYWLTNCVLQT